METTPEPVVVVRHGCSTCRTGCKTGRVEGIKAGDAIVARTERGVEYALVLTDPKIPEAGDPPPTAEAVRIASPEDRERQAEIDREGHSPEFLFCRARIEERELAMKLVKVEKLLGGGRLVFYFLAETRVDFRDLVRDLATEYRMRIELKQIGARDEAKVLGDVSYCGRELCCSSWIRDMRPVTMKMAKNQKATLDPTKISGMCGRLLCCLRYEDEVYTELRRALPRRGARVRVRSSGGTGMVLHQEVIQSKCLVLLDKGGTATVPADDLEPESPGARAPAGDEPDEA